MPIELNATKTGGNTKQIVDKFRQKIPDGSGYTILELSPLTGISVATLRRILTENRWAVRRFVPGSNNHLWLLVNPRDLKKYADQS